MKAMIMPILAGSLLLAALPALAASSGAADAYAEAAADRGLAATRFLDDAQSQYDTWYQRMADLDLDILNRSVTMSVARKARLDRAWDDLKRRWSDLRTASGGDWSNASAAWQQAATRMQQAWQRLGPAQG